jgi:hypothetical protein
MENKQIPERGNSKNRGEEEIKDIICENIQD